ncbi:hypothetical protein SAMN04488003_101127 [Loktanella fryxellensis]|uniref:Uncharacterized protein n=1 Tax=Loktanella fryxellensis TaxID=245187 RepID=A0A1H7YDY4_9RHOB|nr:hypothetical protein [Loktanella fryxellensis]SEM44163.1 hypothetical protein SAMN04488003_101127 [Loktanella fryxellensis]
MTQADDPGPSGRVDADSGPFGRTAGDTDPTGEVAGEPDPSDRAASVARVRELLGFYAGLKAAFLLQMAHIGMSDTSPPKAMTTKLAELQATHVHLLKAEDSFIEKFGTGADVSAVDHDALRRDIGRTLDRIRDTALAGGVSGGAEPAGAAGAAASVRILGDGSPAAAGG